MYICKVISVLNWFLERQILSYLWFNIQDGNHALGMDLPDSLQSSSIHGVLMAAILQVVIVADVLHHLFMRHKVVVLSILLILLWRSSCIWVERRTGELKQ